MATEIQSSVFNERLMRDGERHFDYHNFDDLLELARSVCLRNPQELEIDKLRELSSEEQLLCALGVRGLSLACDILDNPRSMYFGPTESAGGQVYISATLPLRFPARINGQMDIGVMRKIEGFGAALLDEAYISLGTDVKEKIRAFTSAEDDATQIAVLEWLDTRIDSFTKKASLHLAGDEQAFYHPARLSPRLLGQYPHNMFNPTCLGKSTLASSFMRQTGARSLHAGVVKTVHEEGLDALATTLYGFLGRDDVHISDLVAERLLDKATALRTHPDNGFHAVSLIQLQSGAWYVVDPNFRGSAQLAPADSERIQRAYDDVHGFGPNIKGVERTVGLRTKGAAAVTSADIAWLAFERMEPLEVDADEVSRYLLDADEETLLSVVRSSVHDALIGSLGDGDDSLSFANKSLQKLARMYDAYEARFRGEIQSQSILSEAIERTIDGYFLWEESPADIVRRLREDAAYRVRKVEDIQALPYIALFNAALTAHDTEPLSDSGIYEVLEVGATEHRVGAAVLSDFASYCGNDMSYSFWVSHWSSKIPITERINESRIEHEAGLVLNNTGWLSHVLNYSKQSGII